MAEQHEVHEIHHEHEGSSMGFMVGIFLLIIAVFLFIYFLLPVIRQSTGTQINVPDKIDVNINQGK